eukprot:CAMPEP_0113674172 /NCGR_PEP_ID=MMETSP0038_2-20120614/7265_1 /TAXON_ID=2898 /ORGANISM="Cryptomonas paramecium" /LENGTH=56 /DNA_ID=CAMNT_0000590711 /DNA_START=253 /DNA_END=420 /DNA_ORIENTATION=+ /assembly_acc=CAM_ASM_000170
MVMAMTATKPKTTKAKAAEGRSSSRLLSTTQTQAQFLKTAMGFIRTKRRQQPLQAW